MQDQTKFDFLVSSPNNATAPEVKSVVNPPGEDKCNALKVALLSAFGKSQTQKDAELLNISSVGDRTHQFFEDWNP